MFQLLLFHLAPIVGGMPVLVRTATNAPPTAVAVAAMCFPCTMPVCSGSSRLCSQFEILNLYKIDILTTLEQINQNSQFKSIQSITHATDQCKTHANQAKQRKTASEHSPT